MRSSRRTSGTLAKEGSTNGRSPLSPSPPPEMFFKWTAA